MVWPTVRNTGRSKLTLGVHFRTPQMEELIQYVPRELN